ncbi:MAG: archaeal proteasome endopeptidase complex subunit alpha [Halodesulfurarchaeum sp.]
MQGRQQQQAYDRGITIFSPDGRLYQVEYAREAVKRGTASIGVRADDGVALIADKPSRSTLIESDSVEKLHKVDDHIGIASAGLVADARQLIDFARRDAQLERLRYEQPMGVEALTKSVTDHIQQYTQIGGARPFGVALLVGGLDDGRPHLFEIDPSGTPYEWRAIAIGSDREDLQAFLQDHYDPEMDLSEAVSLGLRALGSVSEEPIDPSEVGAATVDAKSERYLQLTDEELREALAEADLLSE